MSMSQLESNVRCSRVSAEGTSAGKDVYKRQAMDLGCTPWQALTRVVIPDIMPGIVSGFIMAFTLSLDDFVVSWFATDGIQNLSIYIYSSARRGISPKINALSTLMFVAVVTLLLFINLKSCLLYTSYHQGSNSNHTNLQ